MHAQPGEQHDGEVGCARHSHVFPGVIVHLRPMAVSINRGEKKQNSAVCRLGDGWTPPGQVRAVQPWSLRQSCGNGRRRECFKALRDLESAVPTGRRGPRPGPSRTRIAPRRARGPRIGVALELTPGATR